MMPLAADAPTPDCTGAAPVGAADDIVSNTERSSNLRQLPLKLNRGAFIQNVLIKSVMIYENQIKSSQQFHRYDCVQRATCPFLSHTWPPGGDTFKVIWLKEETDES